MKKTKIHIWEYDFTIYPRKLWVVDAEYVPYLNEYFAFCDVYDRHTENPESYKGIRDDWDSGDFAGQTCPVIYRKTGDYGVLVILSRNSFGNSETVAHESVHVADYIFQEVNMNSEDFSDGNEAYAYLVGWSAGNISSSIIKSKKCK